MLKIPFTILGKPWTIRLLKKRKYTQKNGADSVAVTKGWKRTIDLGPDGLDLETIVHELGHAYRVEMCTGSSDMSPDDIEEFFCELLAKRGKEILELADALEATVKRLTLSKESV